MNCFEFLPSRTRERLQALAARLDDGVLTDRGSLSIRTRCLDPDTEPKELLQNVPIRRGSNEIYLYYFRLVDDLDLTEIERVFREATQEHTRAYPRLNQHSTFFYVGSSRNMYQRLREHLGYGSGKTYSLQLAHWASNSDLELGFHYARYSSGTADEVVQVIEDTLWDELRPMFGRRGQR